MIIETKKIVYVVPSNGIIEHIKKIIEDNPNLNMKRDFPNLEFKTYQSFIALDKEEIKNIDCDLLILDEFHHIGAPVWGARVNTMIETHPKMKIFGMTAYTVRDRGTLYERDMANPDTDELFSGKIESRYDLCDAMIDGVLPKPVYKSAYTNLIGLESKLEERVQKFNATSREYQEYMAILSDVKRRIHEAPSIPSILRKSIKTNGKYIYFCPPCSEEGTNDIETIKKQAIEWFKQFVPKEDIIIYTSTSDMGEDGKLNRDAFYDDVTLEGEKVDNKLRVMFAINQYNEGIHAPNIDGVIMGRGTASDIVYFEQLGRALSVRGNTKEMFDELEKYSIEQLIEMCKSRDISVKGNATKEDLIEKLIAPVVIDLTNNYEFIKELENNLRDRIKDIQTNGLGSHRDIKIRDASFDIEIENQDLYEMLRYVSDRLTMTWEDYYELAKAYYEHHDNLLIPYNFKTTNGFEFEANGIVNLGQWINNQRRNYKEMSEERKQKLALISFVPSAFDKQWLKYYELAKVYYEYQGNLLIPSDFKTSNGYIYDNKGVNLGKWIRNQRCSYEKLTEERKQELSKIGFVANVYDEQWNQFYELAKIYYEHYKNLKMPRAFKTTNGIDYNKDGFNLWQWINNQRAKYNTLSEERKTKLLKIGFVESVYDERWDQFYKLAKVYYEHNGNLEISSNFKTNDGYTYDENGFANLGKWINNQRAKIPPESERGILLSQIGMRFAKLDTMSWEDYYKLAKKFYEKYGNLKIPDSFITNDGYTNFINGSVKLGQWIRRQRQTVLPESERGQLLLQIGMIFNIKKNKDEIANICIINGIDQNRNKSVLKRISIQELQSKIEFLKSHNIPIVDENGLLIDIFSMSSPDMKEKYGISLEEIINEYYIKNQMGKGV